MSKLLYSVSVILMFVAIGYLASCDRNKFIPDDNLVFKSKLSEYGIYTDPPISLASSDEYKRYEVATDLFSDYSQKQRLIKLPAGKKLTANGDGLPDIPDGTVIVKTFYYYKNEADTSLGKKIIETRLLILNNNNWNAATYLWNDEQTDATLLSTAVDKAVNWIDRNGQPRVISYHIPSKVECSICHQSGSEIIPIGLKIRNLNMDVTHNGSLLNQLNHLQNIGLLSPMNSTGFSKLPDWKDPSYTIEERARAYLDINCGHCHNESGHASGSSLKLAYETSLQDSKIDVKKEAINSQMSRGSMPLIGTTVIDREGLKLVQSYLETLR
jgi:uncharacterized repeat protein (TIGR03806 family)